MIQTTRYLVDLEQVIKREGKVRRKNRGDYLESVIKEDRGKKGDDFETGGKEDLFESVEQEDFEKVRQDYYNPSDPPYPPRISQRTVLGRIWKQLGRRITPHLEEFKEQLSRRSWKELGRRIMTQLTHPPHQEEVNKKSVLLYVMLELGIKSGRKRTMSL